MPRAQPGRKRLAVHARQLALEPRLQILRRSRRPLLQRLEQARRSALAHHVHRTAPMGARVLINGTWYNTCTGPRNLRPMMQAGSFGRSTMRAAVGQSFRCVLWKEAAVRVAT